MRDSGEGCGKVKARAGCELKDLSSGTDAILEGANVITLNVGLCSPGHRDSKSYLRHSVGPVTALSDQKGHKYTLASGSSPVAIFQAVGRLLPFQKFLHTR